MGWAADDQSKVEQAKVLLAKVRIATYPLNQMIVSIKHDEKRAALCKEAQTIESAIARLETHLNR
jgi:hypothetical protein